MSLTTTCEIIRIHGATEGVVDHLLTRLGVDRPGAGAPRVVLITSETPGNAPRGAAAGQAATGPERIDVRLDFENLFFALRRHGYSTRPKPIIAMLKAALAGDGDIVNITAYADWFVLEKMCQGYPLQRELTRQGVDTRFVISEHGKNTADMKIVNDIRTLLERAPGDPDSAEVIVLGSHDRDFQSLLETAAARGRRLILLGLRDDISRLLLQSARDVRYLDLAFVASDQRASPRADTSAQPATSTTGDPALAPLPWPSGRRPPGRPKLQAARAALS